MSCRIELAFAALMMPLSRYSRSTAPLTAGMTRSTRIFPFTYVGVSTSERRSLVIHWTKRHLSPRPNTFTHQTHLPLSQPDHLYPR